MVSVNLHDVKAIFVGSERTVVTKSDSFYLHLFSEEPVELHYEKSPS